MLESSAALLLGASLLRRSPKSLPVPALSASKAAVGMGTARR